MWEKDAENEDTNLLKYLLCLYLVFSYRSKMFLIPELGCNINSKSVMYFVSHMWKGSAQLGETGKGEFFDVFTIFRDDKSLG